MAALTVTQGLNCSISGRLAFLNDDKKALPDADMKVRIFAKGQFGLQTYLGTVRTDQKGRFHFRYHWAPYFWEKGQNLVLSVVEKRRPFASQGLPCLNKQVVVETIPIHLPLRAGFHDIGTVHLTYDNIPQDLTHVEKPATSQMQSPAYFWRLITAVLPELLKSITFKIFQRWIALPRLQAIYDSFGPSYPKRMATPDQLIDELLNEICATDYEVSDNQVTWTANWDGLGFDTDRSLPNVKVVTHKRGEKLQLDRIEIQFREDQVPRIVQAGDVNVDWAIFVARSVFALKGEAEIHLAEGHLLPGIAGKAFFKYIKPDNPIFSVIAPHASQLDFINWLGAQGIIFGKGSVLETSSLTDSAVSQTIIDHMKKKANYLQDVPKAPINMQHHKARVSCFHYEILLDFFREYLSKHREEIVKCKSEIYRWSRCMHGKMAEIPEIMESEEKFSAKEEERLARCLAWLVHKTTFLHWAAHSRQELLTDVRTAALGMREFGFTESGQLAFGGNMDPVMANNQLFTSRVLLNFRGATLTSNPYGDIHPDLIHHLQERREEYLPYNVDEMHLTTQI